MSSIECAQHKIRLIVAGSRVPEDSRHADNTLDWLLRLEPDADDALQLAALAHDIDRAIEDTKIDCADFDDYDAFKAAHARNGAVMVDTFMNYLSQEAHRRLLLVDDVLDDFFRRWESRR